MSTVSRAFFLSFLSRVRHFSLTDDACTNREIGENRLFPNRGFSRTLTTAQTRANDEGRTRRRGFRARLPSITSSSREKSRFFPKRPRTRLVRSESASSPRPRRRPFDARLRERVATHIAFAAGDEPVIPPELSATTPRRGVTPRGAVPSRSRVSLANSTRTEQLPAVVARHAMRALTLWCLAVTASALAAPARANLDALVSVGACVAESQIAGHRPPVVLRVSPWVGGGAQVTLGVRWDDPLETPRATPNTRAPGETSRCKPRRAPRSLQSLGRS